MRNLEVTSMSSRGQVVIPREIRKNLDLREGEKFVVVADGDAILLKKLVMPSFAGFEKLLKKTQQFSKKQGVTKASVAAALKHARK